MIVDRLGNTYYLFLFSPLSGMFYSLPWEDLINILLSQDNYRIILSPLLYPFLKQFISSLEYASFGFVVDRKFKKITRYYFPWVDGVFYNPISYWGGYFPFLIKDNFNYSRLLIHISRLQSRGSPFVPVKGICDPSLYLNYKPNPLDIPISSSSLNKMEKGKVFKIGVITAKDLFPL